MVDWKGGVTEQIGSRLSTAEFHRASKFDIDFRSLTKVTTNRRTKRNENLSDTECATMCFAHVAMLAPSSKKSLKTKNLKRRKKKKLEKNKKSHVRRRRRQQTGARQLSVTNEMLINNNIRSFIRLLARGEDIFELIISFRRRERRRDNICSSVSQLSSWRLNLDTFS